MSYIVSNFVRCELAAELAVDDSTVDIMIPDAPWETPPDPDGETSVLTVMDNLTAPTKVEVITYTGRTDNGDGTVTLSGLIRGMEGTTNQTWSAGTPVIQSITGGTLENLSTYIILPSELISPADGTIDITEVPILEAGGFLHDYGRSHNRSQFQVATDADFATITYDSGWISATQKHQVPSGNLNPSLTYYWRVRYEDDAGHVSDWPSPFSMTTMSTFVYIEPPTITSPTGGATDVGLLSLIETEAFNVVGSSDTHVSTDWRILLASNGSVVWESLADTINLESISPPYGTLSPETEYVFQVQHNGATYGASGYGSVTATTVNVYIEQPTNVFPAADAIDVRERPALELSAFNVVNGMGLHLSSQFRVYKVSDGTLVYDTGVIDATTTDKLPADILEVSTEYEFHGCYRGRMYGWSAWSNWSALTTFTTRAEFNVDDLQPTIQYGDETLGFYGEVAVDNFISGDALASAIGLSAGTAQNNSEPWLKFSYQGVDMYVAKKNYRNNTPFEDIYEAGAVYGSGDTGNEPHATWSQLDWYGAPPTATTQNAQVEIQGILFDVRLLQGAGAEFGDPATTTDHNEWNQLIYAVYEDTNSEGWGVNYSKDDLNMWYTSGTGPYSWVQESQLATKTRRYVRYGGTASMAYYTHSASSYTGWRPCLVPTDR